MANPLVSLATRALKGVAKRTAGRTTVGKAFKAAMKDVRPVVQTAKKATGTINKVTNTIEHGANIAPRPIQVNVNIPSYADLLKENKELKKQIKELEQWKKEHEKKTKPGPDVIVKSFDKPTSYDYYYEEQRRLFWEALEDRSREASFKVAQKWLEEQIEEIEEYLDEIGDLSPYDKDRAKTALANCTAVLNDLNDAFHTGMSKVVEFEGDTP